MTDITKPVYLEEKLAEINNSGRVAIAPNPCPPGAPGCGYYAIVEAMTTAFNLLAIVSKDTVVLSGIGCASRFPLFVNTCGFDTLHGRLLPVAVVV